MAKKKTIVQIEGEFEFDINVFKNRRKKEKEDFSKAFDIRGSTVWCLRWQWQHAEEKCLKAGIDFFQYAMFSTDGESERFLQDYEAIRSQSSRIQEFWGISLIFQHQREWGDDVMCDFRLVEGEADWKKGLDMGAPVGKFVDFLYRRWPGNVFSIVPEEYQSHVFSAKEIEKYEEVCHQRPQIQYSPSIWRDFENNKQSKDKLQKSILMLTFGKVWPDILFEFSEDERAWVSEVGAKYKHLINRRDLKLKPEEWKHFWALALANGNFRSKNKGQSLTEIQRQYFSRISKSLSLLLPHLEGPAIERGKANFEIRMLAESEIPLSLAEQKELERIQKDQSSEGSTTGESPEEQKRWRSFFGKPDEEE